MEEHMIKLDKTILDEEVVEEMKRDTYESLEFALEWVHELLEALKDKVNRTRALDAKRDILKTTSTYRDTLTVWRLHRGEEQWDILIAELQSLGIGTRQIGDIKRYVNQDMRRQYEEAKARTQEEWIAIEDVSDFLIRYDKSERTLYIKKI